MADGQMFEAAVGKVAYIEPGVFASIDGAECASRPDDEMNGPPVERYEFDYSNARGVYSRTEGFCGGGNGTYSGDCNIHSYCIQAEPNSIGLVMTFLEPSPTPSAERKATYDRVVDSVRLAP